MIIIERLYWFTSWIVITTIVTMVVLMVLRLIANQLDLNPFSWSALTIRRLTDPFIGPMRRTLARYGADAKYAPLVLILLTILLGWFSLQLLNGLANTIAGVLFGLTSGRVVALLGYIIYGLVTIYIMLVFVRIILAYTTLGYGNRFMRFLINVTEPLLGPLRRMVPTVGMFDISPLVAFVILWILHIAIAGTLLQGMPLKFF
ncbi:MAG TPA: YggT family protein [Pyrinomonadaceae bacterium]|nr:YggT family protein [Pyrinomonadaceae bacterium]